MKISYRDYYTNIGQKKQSAATADRYSKLVEQRVGFLLENKKQAKTYVENGSLSQQDFDDLLKSDPSPTKKYVGWMAKQWIKPDKNYGIDDMRNTVEEYDTFVQRGRVEIKDINQFESFQKLKDEVDRVNQSGTGMSSSELEEDYDVIVDNNKVYVAVPHSHEASRKLGLTKFAFRDCEGGSKDSAWCTTYKAPDHFVGYYYKQADTLYYILIKDEELLNRVMTAFPERIANGKKSRGIAMKVSALKVSEDGSSMELYDGTDSLIREKSEINKFLKILGLQ